MFKKIEFRLVALNAIVFILLLNALGSTLYFSVKHRLYTQVDRELQQIVNHMQEDHFRNVIQERKRVRWPDNRIVLLLWGEEGKIVRTAVEEAIDEKDLTIFRPSSKIEYRETAKVNGNPYRVYSVPVQIEVQAGGQWKEAKTIQLIYDLESEDKMLGSLLFVISVGGLISIAIAALAGLFLAKRALIPIQLSWAKQQQFIADASHELRTPLAVILVHLERLFRNPDHTIEQESENIFISIQETKRLNKLVTDLLTLARSDSNELQIMNQTVKLDRIIQQSILNFQYLANLKEIQIETDIDHPIEITGDEERLHQLIVILLDNALKYSNEKGQITVTCKRSGNMVLISVVDTGMGISKEDLDLIFDRFYRGDKMRSRAADGTGLGLSIAKWIVDAHGGKIRAESEAGAGTSFYVTIPFR